MRFIFLLFSFFFFSSLLIILTFIFSFNRLADLRKSVCRRREQGFLFGGKVFIYLRLTMFSFFLLLRPYFIDYFTSSFAVVTCYDRNVARDAEPSLPLDLHIFSSDQGQGKVGIAQG